MRIVYGVHGYGQGHATRCLAVLPELSRRHEVLVLAGGHAYGPISQEYKTHQVPVFGFEYRPDGTRSTFKTLRSALPVAIDALSRGPVFRMVTSYIRDFAPDVIVSDAEMWTHWVGRRLGIPRINFDHFGILAHFRHEMPALDHLWCSRDVWIYRRLISNPDRVLVSSFYPAEPIREGIRLVPPLLRREVFEVEASTGEHLLAYFNNGDACFTDRMERTLKALNAPVIIYGTGRVGRNGLLEYRPHGNRGFIEALATCRAVISTAGNQLVGEAVHFGKPILVMPEDCVEQRINARAVESLGIGRHARLETVSVDSVRRFLDQEQSFRKRIQEHRGDGRQEVLAALEHFFRELTCASEDSDSPSLRSVA